MDRIKAIKQVLGAETPEQVSKKTGCDPIELLYGSSLSGNVHYELGRTFYPKLNPEQKEKYHQHVQGNVPFWLGVIDGYLEANKEIQMDSVQAERLRKLDREAEGLSRDLDLLRGVAHRLNDEEVYDFSRKFQDLRQKVQKATALASD